MRLSVESELLKRLKKSGGFVFHAHRSADCQAYGDKCTQIMLPTVSVQADPGIVSTTNSFFIVVKYI